MWLDFLREYHDILYVQLRALAAAALAVYKERVTIVTTDLQPGPCGRGLPKEESQDTK